MTLVDVGISVRQVEENPWYTRLMESLQSIPAGVPAEILVEAAPELTKVEKRLRLFRRSSARYLCLIEDDVQVIHDGWLVQMLSRMPVLQNAAIMNPAETRMEPSEIPVSELKDEVQEITNAAGFCMLIDRESGILPDVRVQTMDDLWLSLAARARGYRIVRSLAAIVRHSKQPWLSDDHTPQEQADRSRFGENHPYYKQDAHEAKRRLEARLMVEQFGDLARITLPKELLPWADPLHEDFGMAWDRGQPIAYKT